MTGKPTVPGNWVYSIHDYNFSYGTFSDGVVRHDDFGITLANAVLANANAWQVPLYIGEFTTFSLGVDARQLTNASMAQTKTFLAWAKQNSVSWTFWAYVNPYWPMTFLNYQTNQPIPVVKDALATGLDTSETVSAWRPDCRHSHRRCRECDRLIQPANRRWRLTDHRLHRHEQSWQYHRQRHQQSHHRQRPDERRQLHLHSPRQPTARAPACHRSAATASRRLRPHPSYSADPGFESGTSGWSAFNVGTFARVTTPVRAGGIHSELSLPTTAANLVGMTNNAVVTNSVRGRLYTFQCYVRPTNAGIRVTARLMQYTQAFGSGTTLATTQSTTLAANTWTVMRITGTATQNGYRVIPQAYSTNQTSATGTVYYDDCSVTSGAPPPVSAPGAPTAVSAVAGDGQATVSFTPPVNNGGAPITGYSVTSTPGNITASGAGSPITVGGLTNGTAYSFTATAINNAGQSAPSSASNSVTPTAASAAELLPDPGFESGVGGWVAFNVGTLARVASPARGTGAMRITAPSTAIDLVGMTQNSVVTSSVLGRTTSSSATFARQTPAATTSSAYGSTPRPLPAA